MSLLHEFASKGKTGTLKKLLESGSIVNLQNANGETALHTAVAHSQQRCMKLLLKHGANPNTISKDGHSPVDIAKSSPSCLKILIRYGGIIFKENEKAILRRMQYKDEAETDVISGEQLVPEISINDVTMNNEKSADLICFGRILLHQGYWYGHSISIKTASNFQKISDENIKQYEQHLLHNELEILSKLHHQNVINLLAANFTQSSFNRPTFGIFEPIRYGNLTDAMREGKLKFTDDYVCCILLKVASAIEYIHTKSVLHNFINASSIYYGDAGKITLSDFIYAQEIDHDNKPINGITSQLPWMAPAQSRGELPEIYSDIYSFGALAWQLIAKRVPCHWTTCDFASNDDNAFVFPFDEHWNLTMRNIISFCIHTTVECRPDMKTIIELLEQEFTLLSKNGNHSTKHDLARNFSNAETEYEKRINFVANSKDNSLETKLSKNSLTIVKGKRLINLARQHERRFWAKELVFSKQAEKMYLERNAPIDRKEVAIKIMKGHSYSMTKIDKITNKQNSSSKTPVKLTKKRDASEKMVYFEELLKRHQRKNWSKIVTYERSASKNERT
eukprot:gene14059-15524_t